MPISSKVLQSPLLDGIVIDHDDHPEAAPMRSTGRVALRENFPEGEVDSWYVEYKCDVCGELIHMYSVDTHDLVRQILIANKIIKA